MQFNYEMNIFARSRCMLQKDAKSRLQEENRNNDPSGEGCDASWVLNFIKIH